MPNRGIYPIKLFDVNKYPCCLPDLVSGKNLARLLHGIAASASVLFVQAACTGLPIDSRRLMQARALDNSPRSHEQMYVLNMTPQQPL